MTLIRQDDFVHSIERALQYISYYHPPDFVRALNQAYEREAAPAARDALAQILINSRLCAEGRRPVCQDTGIVVVFVRVGTGVRWHGNRGLQALVDEGVRRAWRNADNPLRASIVSDPIGKRVNTKDNTPAVVHTELTAGEAVEVEVAAKGGGSEAKSRFAMLNPSDDIADWVLEQVPAMGAGWCPPGILGIGVGGSAEKAMVLAKQACLEPVDIQDLQARGPSDAREALRLDLFERINRLGIGAQGLGGLTTVLDVKVRDAPCHAANKPVAIVPNCAATRHVRFTLDGSGPVELEPPRLRDWPQVTRHVAGRRVSLDTLTRETIAEFEPGEVLLVSGSLLTGRDAAHKRIQDRLARGEPLPAGLDFNGRFVYYVGPVDAVGDEVVGPAGPTTATRMDKFTDIMLGQAGVLGMIGKGERGPDAVDAIRRHGAIYLIAVGGAAYLVSRAIRKARVVAFEDLGMEAIHEFEVEDMPVTVAVDSRGQSIHDSGPRYWRGHIKDIPVTVR
ncbi:MAG TPA: fumarate hydratase [Gammaproteobacteria bacterium]|nr:fumarate hydratase [Gammaproteobacteria bacterium]